jgi:hypothetical protein
MTEKMSLREAADYLGVCTDTVVSERNAGRLIVPKARGRYLYFKRHLDDYLALLEREAVERAEQARALHERGRKITPIRAGAGKPPPVEMMWRPGDVLNDDGTVRHRKVK